MKAKTWQLPEIAEWPYAEIQRAQAEFQAIWNRDPTKLLVGLHLWIQLHNTSPEKARAKAFNYGSIPIELDSTGIVADRDFMFTR